MNNDHFEELLIIEQERGREIQNLRTEIRKLKLQLESEKTLYILLADGDGCMRSIDEPIGVAVTTEEEAKRYVKEKGVGFTHSYQKIHVFKDKDRALDYLYPARIQRRSSNE